MKPRFALYLTNEAISLLERRGEGWVRIGKVDLTAPDLDSRFRDLSAIAQHRGGDGFVSKLVLPNTQILYLELQAPGPDRAAQRVQIRQALEGRTPYGVDDLVFDWSRSGQTVKVAVLARETLDEAEEFAERYGFRPVAFVAVPDGDRFGGEPYFGLTALAKHHLPPDERFDRDQDAVRIMGEDLVAPAPRAALEEQPETAAEGLDPPAPQEPLATGQDEEAGAAAPAEAAPVESGGTGLAEPGPMIAPPADAEGGEETGAPEPEGVPAGEPEMAVSAEAGAGTTQAEPGPEPDNRISFEAEAMESASVFAPSVDAHQVEPADVLADDAVAASTDEAPFIALDDGSADAAEAIAHVAEAEAPDLDAAQTAGDIAAFQSRRAPGPSGQEGARLAEITPRLGGLSGIQPPGKAPRLGAAAALKRSTASRMAGLGPQPPSAMNGRAALPSRADTLAGRGARPFDRAMAVPAPEPARTVFGALKDAAAEQPATRLLLAASLMVLIAAGALWSLWFSGNSGPEPDLAVAANADPDRAPAPAPTAPPAQAASAPAEGAPATPDPAEAAAPAMADLPQPQAPTTPPASPPAATSDPTSPPAVSVTESAPPATPGTGLPALAASVDAPLPAQPLPQPFGTLIRYDAAGLIVATPEGVITPDGFTLFASRPPRLPPARPAGLVPAAAPGTAVPTDQIAPPPDQMPLQRPEELAPNQSSVPEAAEPAAPVAAAAPLPDPVDPRHAARKPLSRPAGIVAQAEAKRLNDERVADAAASAARAEAEAAEKALAAASRLAVASSRRPAERSATAVASAAAAAMAAAVPAPRAVDNGAVEAALAEAQAATAKEPAPAPQVEVAAAAPADPIPEELDEPEPQEGVPNMPTTRTVAKKSTIANAIDLGDINLIGVYGSSANRRALVRMPNGRFVKVKVGDRLDGGQVAAIGESELSYVKRGRTYVLKMVKNS